MCRSLFLKALSGILPILLPVATGFAAWWGDPNGNNLVAGPSGTQDQQVACTDGSGGVIVAWRDGRAGSPLRVYAQRLDSNGDAQWTSGGVVVSSGAAATVSTPLIAADNSGGAIIAWQDSRNGNADLFAARVDGTGSLVWASDVVVTTATGNQNSAAMAPDGVGGAVVAWTDNRSGNLDVYAQRISGNAEALWTDGGVPVAAYTNGQTFVSIAQGTPGNTLVAWADARGGSGSDIYVQKLDLNGADQWTTGGVLLCGAADSQVGNRVISDGSGGAIVAWEDRRQGAGNLDVYAGRVDSSGTPQWTSNGVALTTASLDQAYPSLATDGSGGAIIAWHSRLDAGGTDYDVLAQRVDSTGAAQWTPGGVNLKTDTMVSTGVQVIPVVISDGAGGAVIAWEDSRSNVSMDAYAQRLDNSGTALWADGGVAVSTAGGNQSGLAATASPAGAILSWVDSRGDAGDIYAARVTPGGLLPAGISRIEVE